jgi:transcriptional regulator GlxA family with amidase domain
MGDACMQKERGDRRVVPHWEACEHLAQYYPEASVETDPIFIEDGDLWTSAGVTAGIDMTLALAERDLGHPAAMFAA